MERVFTKDIGKNFKRGQIADYPMPTWRDIEASAKEPLDSFTKSLEDAVKAGLVGSDSLLRRMAASKPPA